MRFVVLALLLAPLAVSAQTTAADSAFAQEVRYRAELDQIVRRLPYVRYQAGTPRDSMDAGTAGLWSAVDSLNSSWAVVVLAEGGWPKRSEVGSRAAVDFWALVSHSPLATQQAALPLLQRAVAEGEAGSDLLALTVDRVRMLEGEPQVYGSQIRFVDGEPIPYAIEDEANVDARRRSVGLDSLASYLDSFRHPGGHH